MQRQRRRNQDGAVNKSGSLLDAYLSVKNRCV